MIDIRLATSAPQRSANPASTLSILHHTASIHNMGVGEEGEDIKPKLNVNIEYEGQSTSQSAHFLCPGTLMDRLSRRVVCTMKLKSVTPFAKVFQAAEVSTPTVTDVLLSAHQWVSVETIQQRARSVQATSNGPPKREP